MVRALFAQVQADDDFVVALLQHIYVLLAYIAAFDRRKGFA